MDAELVQSLKDIQNENSHWTQDPVISHGDIPIQLCQVIGEDANVPPNIPDQSNFPPKFAKYRFDINKYKGEDSAAAIQELIRSSCPGCKLFTQVEGKERIRGFLTWHLYCSRYAVESRSPFYGC